MLSEQPQRALLYASKTPRYQTATFRPVRAPVLPGYGPGDHIRVRTAANGVRNGRRGDALRSSTWQSLCSTPWSWTRRAPRHLTLENEIGSE